VDASFIIIGGGPAGSAAGRLLASWGHRVLLLNRPADRSRGLAESLPPSTRKLLAAVGVLDAIEAEAELGRIYRSTGNTVWWGASDRRVESFDPQGEASGFQILRPEFDRVLLASAAAAGVDVRQPAVARAVHFEDERVRVEYEQDGHLHSASAHFVLDCSGRAGAIARRHRQPGHRMFALVGVWRAPGGWRLPDDTHTLVQAYADGWAWSIPVDATTRHIGAMVDGVSPLGGLAQAYRTEIGKAVELGRLPEEAALDRVWACDASTYTSDACTGPRYILVGDAASCIDPLSSCGVKKSLASAWLAAIVANTCLEHPGREAVAFDFFTRWEREVSATHARLSRDFAREAVGRFPTPFWTRRANAEVEDAVPVDSEPDVHAALRVIQDSEEIDLTPGDAARLEPRAVIRGREIVIEDAFPSGLRFRENVDLVGLAQLAGSHRHVPDLFDAYCRMHGPVPMPSMLGGLSVLVAKGILNIRTAR
jgi:flavin-dependent dehydrogenase